MKQQNTLDISWRVNLNSAKRKVILICYHNTHSASWVKCNRQEVLKSPQTFTLHHSFPHFSSWHIHHLLATQMKMWSCPLDRTTHSPAHQEILLVLPSNTSGVQLLLTPPLDSLRSLLGSNPLKAPHSRRMKLCLPWPWRPAAASLLILLQPQWPWPCLQHTRHLLTLGSFYVLSKISRYFILTSPQCASQIQKEL